MEWDRTWDQTAQWIGIRWYKAPYRYKSWQPTHSSRSHEQLSTAAGVARSDMGAAPCTEQEREEDLVTSAVSGRPMTAAFLPAFTSHGPPPTDTPAHACLCQCKKYTSYVPGQPLTLLSVNDLSSLLAFGSS